MVCFNFKIHTRNEAHVILDWCAAFRVPDGLIYDVSTHFRNEPMRLVTKSLRKQHYFTLPCCLWSNEAVKRLGSEFLRITRSLILELQLGSDSWPDLIPLFSSVLNHTPSHHRAKTTPITAFTGLAATPPISTILY